MRQARQYARVAKGFDVVHSQCKWTTLLAGEGETSKTCNFSAGGVMMETKASYNVGQLINMQVKIPDWQEIRKKFSPDLKDDSNHLNVVGKVVRVEPAGDKTFRVGIKYESIDPLQQHALESMCSSL